jgi:hypothetical protein
VHAPGEMAMKCPLCCRGEETQKNEGMRETERERERRRERDGTHAAAAIASFRPSAQVIQSRDRAT